MYLNVLIVYLGSVLIASSMTHPMPPQTKSVDPLKIFPGLQVPENPSKYIWKISPKTKSPADASVIVIAPPERPQIVGVIPKGTTIDLISTILVGSVSFYEVPQSLIKFKNPLKLPASTKYWVSGNDIKAVQIK